MQRTFFHPGCAIAALMLITLAPVAAASSDLERDERLRRTLEETVVSVDYDRRDLVDVVRDLRQQFDLNMHVAWNALDQIGAQQDTRVTVQLDDVTLDTVFDVLTGQLGDHIAPAAYGIRDGVVVIATAEAFRRHTVMHAYDVTDLLESGYALRRFANTPVLALRLTGREFVGGERFEYGGGGAGGGGASTFGDPGEEPDRLSRMERIEQLVDLLTTTIDPDLWAIHGGETAFIECFRNHLIIRHTPEGHRRIEAFFDMLRSSAPRPLHGDAIVVRLRMEAATTLRREVGAAYPVLTPEQVERLLSEASQDGMLFCSSTSGLNGQRMLFSALTQRSVLTGMMGAVADHTYAFSPISSVTTEGLELIVLPLLGHGGEQVSVDVQMAWVPTADVEDRPVFLAVPEADATIDQVRQRMRTVSSTSVLPLGHGLVLTIPQELPEGGEPATHEDLLIVRIRPGG